MTSEICIIKTQSPSDTLWWATDIHLDFVGNTDEALAPFINAVNGQQPKFLVLTGDIDTAHPQPKEHNLGVIAALKKIQQLVQCQIFFVLGNHDFYGGSIQEVRQRARKFSPETDSIWYLEGGKAIEINPSTALIGCDGWYDGREGDLDNTDMILEDFFSIKELQLNDESELKTDLTKKKLIALSKEGVDQMRQELPLLFKTYQKVILATHVPPFLEACLYQGVVSSDSAAPFFVNKMLGEALTEIMNQHLDKELVVLCGHSHDPATYQALHNLVVYTGGAKYYDPQPQNPIKL